MVKLTVKKAFQTWSCSALKPNSNHTSKEEKKNIYILIGFGYWQKKNNMDISKKKIYNKSVVLNFWSPPWFLEKPSSIGAQQKDRRHKGPSDA